MPKVIYEMGGVSADGYVVGPDGKSDPRDHRVDTEVVETRTSARAS